MLSRNFYFAKTECSVPLFNRSRDAQNRRNAAGKFRKSTREVKRYRARRPRVAAATVAKRTPTYRLCFLHNRRPSPRPRAPTPRRKARNPPGPAPAVLPWIAQAARDDQWDKGRRRRDESPGPVALQKASRKCPVPVRRGFRHHRCRQPIRYPGRSIPCAPDNSSRRSRMGKVEYGRIVGRDRCHCADPLDIALEGGSPPESPA